LLLLLMPRAVASLRLPGLALLLLLLPLLLLLSLKSCAMYGPATPFTESTHTATDQIKLHSCCASS
jgi:hypothetical protein